MNEKEISEIRRRFRPAKSNISYVRGCYVNEKREIVAEFSQSLGLMPEEEAEKFLAILKKTLSGTVNKNLVDIEFTTQQVVDSDEHGLLMALRDSSLKDEDAVHAFFARVISAVALEDNYLVLLAQDTYDVPYRSGDGETQGDASSEVFSYILCSVCPVKLTKPALSYYVYENEFHSRPADWIVSPPELGFMFPTFDDRCANIYKALYYTRDTAESYDDFVDVVFKSQAPLPAAVQKETFQAVLGDTLADDSSLDVVQAVHTQLQGMIEEHKANKEEQPLLVSKTGMRRILQHNGVSEQHLEAFEQRYDAEFGAETEVSPRNLVDTKQIELSTAGVTVRVDAECSDLVQTRVIDGAKYIMVRVQDEVLVNGVPIHIT